MTDTTAASPPAPGGGREPITKPSAARRLTGIYLDLVIVSFLAWVVCFTFGWQGYWSSAVLFLVVGELLWCRDRLHPTAGEFCVGIRYLTSSSTHVVADIQVVHPKLKLNHFILLAGAGEITLAFAFFSGWTFLNRAVMMGYAFGPPFSVIYWVLGGLAFFACGAALLGGSRRAPWIIPPVHAWFLFDFLKSSGAWAEVLKGDPNYLPWVSETLAAAAKSQYPVFLELFGLWSLTVILGCLAFRRHWTN